jgi:hypothetical protein
VIGEDIPSLIPISIIIAVMFLGLTGMLTNYVKKSEAVDLHRAALNIAEKFAYENNGAVDDTRLADSTYWTVTSAQYLVNVTVRDLETGQVRVSTGPNANDFPVAIRLPLLVNGSAGQVEVRMVKKP